MDSTRSYVTARIGRLVTSASDVEMVIIGGIQMNLFKSMLWAFLIIVITLVFIFLVELFVANVSGIGIFITVLVISFIFLTLTIYSESN